MTAQLQHHRPTVGRKPRTFEESLAHAAPPRDLTCAVKTDPAFVPKPSTRVFCQAFMRGLCPNGPACYLVHPPVDNIVAAIDELQRHDYLQGSVNKYWCERGAMKDAHPRTQTSRQICIRFLSDRCTYGNDCVHAHFLPWILRGIVEPDHSPFVMRSNKGKSKAVALDAPTSVTTTLQAPIIAQSDQETGGIMYETPLTVASKPDDPPLSSPMPSTYEDSSETSSELSSNDMSDEESFHTGHSPGSEATPSLPEDAPRLSLPISKTVTPLCFDFYRTGICRFQRGRCRYRHERPSVLTVTPAAAATAAVSRPQPLPDSLSPPSPTPMIPPESFPPLFVQSVLSPSSLPALRNANNPPTLDTGQPEPDPNLCQRSILLRTINYSDSGAKASASDIPPDVCPNWYRHGACRTHCCKFVHSLPEVDTRIHVRLPTTQRPTRSSYETSLSERWRLMNTDGSARASCDSSRPMALPSPLPSPIPSEVNAQRTPVTLHIQQSGIVSDRKPPSGVCYYWFNDRACPHRHPCQFRHDLPANAIRMPGQRDQIVPPVTLGVNPQHVVQTNRAMLPFMPPVINGAKQGHSPSARTLVKSDQSRAAPSTSARQPQAQLQTRPQLQSRVTLAESSSSVQHPATASHSRVSQCGVTSSIAPSAPPGLPELKPSVEEEYCKEGLFTPEQAAPTNTHVSSTTDRFMRDNASLAILKKSQGSRPRGPSYPPEMSHVMHDHIKITLGPGFIVPTVTTQNETRSLIIGNLPRATAKEPLTHLIESFGGTVSDLTMPDPVSSGEEGPVAVRVQMSSHLEAVAVANGLDGMKALRSEGALSVRPTLHRAAVKSQVSDSEIRISWRLPTISLYAGFGSLEAARKAVAAADGYDWDGYWITASVYDGFPVVGEHNVRFSGLPPDVKHKLVRKRFHCGKGDLNTDKPTQALRDFGIPQVEKRVKDFGPVVDFHVAPSPYKDGIVRAWCRFETSDIAGVARELNGIPQVSLDYRKLTVWRIHSLKYPINRNVYGYIGEEIKNLREATWRFRRGCNIRIFDRDAWQDKVTIEISAEDSKSLQEIRARLVDIAQGRIIMDGNVPLWDRFFSTSFGTEWMNTIRKANPTVLIIIRKLQAFIRVIGAPEKRSGVIATIREHVASLRGQPVHTVPLPGSHFGLFMHPALLAARERHGTDNLWLDIQHRQLCVRGDETMYKDVQSAVHTAMKAHPRHLPRDRCPVCFDIPTSPVVLSCGDTYCTDCLASYLAAGTETRQFPLVCFGADGKCKEPIPLVVARDVLRPAQWEQLIAAAFNAHIAARPDEFRFCPTPDCQQVYRPGAKDSVYSCPACLVRICPYCDVEYHEGITCDDRTHKIDSAFDEYVRTHEVKQCPGCKAPIERAEGCNHMTCTRCHTHTCWECMETFDKGIGIYDHMREAHGSIGV
ncbi:unnamed protein product [Peniophora sp. CBMAI 1063]|nr:unnamed protein product [Peniophora sp. CBMAI 1063]